VGSCPVRDRAHCGFPHVKSVFYRQKPLLGCLDAMGLNLRAKWNQHDYLAAALSDAAKWEQAKPEDKLLSDQNLRVYLAEMRSAIKGGTSLTGSLSAGPAGAAPQSKNAKRFTSPLPRPPKTPQGKPLPKRGAKE